MPWRNGFGPRSPRSSRRFARSRRRPAEVGVGQPQSQQEDRQPREGRQQVHEARVADRVMDAEGRRVGGQPAVSIVHQSQAEPFRNPHSTGSRNTQPLARSMPPNVARSWATSGTRRGLARQRLGRRAHELQVLGDEHLGDADGRDRHARAEQAEAMEDQQELPPEAPPPGPVAAQGGDVRGVGPQAGVDASRRNCRRTAVTKAWNGSR